MAGARRPNRSERFRETVVSVRGQTVIPRQVRRLLNIAVGTRLRWEVRDNTIVLHPVLADPLTASLGAFQGRGLALDEFLTERQKG